MFAQLFPGLESIFARDRGLGVVQRKTHALVRFVNATAYTQPVDVYLDEAKVLPEVSKDKVTEYSEWAAKKHDVKLKVEGNLAATAKKSESLDSGKHYTVVGFSKVDGTPAVSIFTDSSSTPDAGKARIRLIHAVTDGLAKSGAASSRVKSCRNSVSPTLRSLTVFVLNPESDADIVYFPGIGLGKLY